MAIEIERKFLVKSPEWKEIGGLFVNIKQGYLSLEVEKIVRVRSMGYKAFLTVKGKNVGITRQEFEYEIPVADAEAMLKMCKDDIVEKTRYSIFGKPGWEIDVFHGRNEGLVLAEIELPKADKVIDIPLWIGKEVSHDSRYYNSNLIDNPYCFWSHEA